MAPMSVEHELNELKSQVRDLDEEVQQLKTTKAVDHERHIMIISRLDKIEGNISKLVWLVFGSLITAFIAFVVSGGIAT